MKRFTIMLAGVAAVAVGLTGCDQAPSTVDRSIDPLVLTGADLPDLLGADPGDVVAFAHRAPDGNATWDQIPVQIDERMVIGFGTEPATDTGTGTVGTVYGNGAPGPTALQYADPTTWVGADPDTTFDADDELVFMVADAGSSVGDEVAVEPAGVVAGSGVAVRVEDPQDPAAVGYVYLFERSGTALDPAAGEDYVDYDFALTSGDYRTTYKRRGGPNPETSTITTDRYTVGYTDRWSEDSWTIDGGPDILDGAMNRMMPHDCGYTTIDFNAAVGAFVANIDGPVRAIRSYVGVLYGPRTQRTTTFYRDHEVTVTDLRVIYLPSIVDAIDLNEAALGSTYRTSAVPGGVTLDGEFDTGLGSVMPTWEAVNGDNGTLVTMMRASTSEGPPSPQFYPLDGPDESYGVCWGDEWSHWVGSAWEHDFTQNTDPGYPPNASYQLVRTNVFLPATDDGALVTSVGTTLADDLDTPVTATATAYAP